jgi:hypothetical protein
MRWLILVDTHLYKGFCGSGASGWKEQAGSVLMISKFSLIFSPSCDLWDDCLFLFSCLDFLSAFGSLVISLVVERLGSPLIPS